MGQQDRGKSGQKAGGQKQQGQSGQSSNDRQDGGRTGMRQGSEKEGNERNRGASGADDMDEGEDIDEGSRPVPSPEGRGSTRTNR
jgi:hypothetical protein